MSYEGHVFFENVQNGISIWKMQKENLEKFFLSEIIASQDVAINSLY